MQANDKYACAELIQALGASIATRANGRSCSRPSRRTGQISVSWFSGAFREFVDRCRRSFEAGQRSKHHILPSIVRVAGDRAVAETNIVIHGAAEDRRRAGRHDLLRAASSIGWSTATAAGRSVERAAIYERDRLDPVEPSEAFDQLFKATRSLDLSGALPLHGGAPRRRRPRARAGGLLRRHGRRRPSSMGATHTWLERTLDPRRSYSWPVPAARRIA